MEVAEFVEETSKIEKFYEKELDTFHRDIWYQELKNKPINRYKQIIKQVFRECKFMPKLADIIEIDKQLPTHAKKEKEKVDCNICKGLGVIFYKKVIADGNKKLEYNYAARCDCANGEEYAYDGKKISDTEHRSKYYIPTIQEEGIIV